MNDPKPSAGVTRVYRAKSVKPFVVGLVLIAAGWFLLLFVWKRTIRVIEDPSLFALIPIVIAVVLGVRTSKNTVCLSESAIAVEGFPGNKLLPFDKIRGRRRYFESNGDSGGVRHLVLEPISERYPRLDIEEIYQFDDHFYRWFNNLPDLDEADKARTSS